VKNWYSNSACKGDVRKQEVMGFGSGFCKPVYDLDAGTYGDVPPATYAALGKLVQTDDVKYKSYKQELVQVTFNPLKLEVHTYGYTDSTCTKDRTDITKDSNTTFIQKSITSNYWTDDSFYLLRRDQDIYNNATSACRDGVTFQYAADTTDVKSLLSYGALGSKGNVFEKKYLGATVPDASDYAIATLYTPKMCNNDTQEIASSPSYDTRYSYTCYMNDPMIPAANRSTRSISLYRVADAESNTCEEKNRIYTQTSKLGSQCTGIHLHYEIAPFTSTLLPDGNVLVYPLGRCGEECLAIPTPTSVPTPIPTSKPSWPTSQPSLQPSVQPSCQPLLQPSSQPTASPSPKPTPYPTVANDPCPRRPCYVKKTYASSDSTCAGPVKKEEVFGSEVCYPLHLSDSFNSTLVNASYMQFFVKEWDYIVMKSANYTNSFCRGQRKLTKKDIRHIYLTKIMTSRLYSNRNGLIVQPS
jgi:hypothetical protein